MSLQSANIALGKLQRSGLQLPRTERVRLYAQAAVALDAADAAIPVADDAGRRKLAAVERRYWRIRQEIGDVGLQP